MSTDRSPIFITGRFRSGTSFLWQLFDQMEGYCAWYEPLHPQLLTAIEYVEPKEDHVGVEDYWTAYRQHPSFSTKYRTDFATNKLYLEGKHNYRELEAYIKYMIMLSGADTPVLQFNRVDLRLEWLREKFPQARIIHIDRNPLQLYHSQRKHVPEDCRDQAGYWDAYELMPWCYALHQEFPFLLDAETDQHAFNRFYTLYQLSKQLAVDHANLSINLDVDVFQSDDFIAKINHMVPLNEQQKRQIKTMTHVPEQRIFTAEYVDAMAEIMTAVDMKLTAAGLTEYFGKRALRAIKFHHPEFWGGTDAPKQDLSELQVASEKLAEEVNRIHQENQYYRREVETLSGGSHKFEDLPVAIFNVDKIQIPTDKTATKLLNYSNQLINAMTQVLAINDYLGPEFYALKQADEAVDNER